MGVVVCTVQYGRQSVASIIQLISSADGTLHYQLRNCDSMLHELHVARAFLLMAIGLGSTWVGKGAPFCSAWFVNSTVDAMSSIEEMFCGIMWLLAIVDNELCYKRRLPQIDLLIFRTTIPALFLVSISNGYPGLRGSSFKKLRTSWHGVHCSFLMRSAHAKGSTIVEHWEALGTTCVVFRISNNLSIKSLHWFNAMVHPTADHQTHLRP